MKFKVYYFFVVMFLNIFINTVIAYDNQYFVQLSNHEELSEYDKFLQFACMPIKFTKSGIRCFFKHTFNCKEYAQDILPHTTGHLIQCLEYGNESGQNCAYMLSSLRLFNNKLKSCSYITPYCLSDTMHHIPRLLKKYITQENESWLSSTKEALKKILYNSFLSAFDLFKKDPDLFFDNLSTTILSELGKHDAVSQSVDKEQLRQGILRLLDTMTSKVIWTPVDQEDVWQSFKTLSDGFCDLMKEDIINQDELDDLLKSLVERFVYFLELVGSDLSLETIEAIKQELEESTLVLNMVDEQEEFLETKIERIKSALLETEAKIHARQRGIITEVIPHG